MTEAEWSNCNDPQPMLEFLRGKVSDRKLRFFALACCRYLRANYDCANPFVMHAIGEPGKRLDSSGEVFEEVIERLAEGGSEEEFDRSVQDIDFQADGRAFIDAACQDACVGAKRAAECVASAAANSIARDPLNSESDPRWAATREGESKVQAAILRDIFGNPFRPATLTPIWLTAAVKQLVMTAYGKRAFEAMPILADALEDAGCTDDDILNHCRQPGEHVRGCWVIDLLLGKE